MTDTTHNTGWKSFTDKFKHLWTNTGGAGKSSKTPSTPQNTGGVALPPSTKGPAGALFGA